MSDFRCKPGNLAMSDSTPYGQRYSYGSEHPMSDMLKASYFISQHDRFRSGDEIRITQHEGSDLRTRITAYAEVLVVEGGKELEFEITRKPKLIPKKEEAKPEAKKAA